jgi:hypothetical protein
MPLPFVEAEFNVLNKGALINFGYTFWKHDPNPLIIVSDVFPDRIRGVNLHYLTFRYIKGLLNSYCDKNYFSYRFIKHDRFIVNSFRTYKKEGITMMKRLDCNVLMTLLTKVRSFNPQEMESIRQEVERQLKAQTNPAAEDLANQLKTNILTPQTGFTPLAKDMRQDARRAFRPGEQPPTRGF